MSAVGRILVVDDDEGIRKLIAMALSDEGYDVLTAPHGAAALDLVGQAPPAVILLDMRMPVMDGWAFLRAYRQMPGPHVPVIAATGARDAAASGEPVEADGHLTKPFDLDELLDLVGQHGPSLTTR